jgi:hypothetical protein
MTDNHFVIGAIAASTTIIVWLTGETAVRYLKRARRWPR